MTKMANEILQKQFNEFGERYIAMDRCHHVKHYSIIPSALGLLGDVRGKRILDIGCGYGLVSRILMEKGAAKVVGIDSSEKMIERARTIEKDKPSGAEYIVCKAEELQPSLNGEYFDDAIAILFFNYIDDWRKMSQVFCNVRANLKSGGRFISFQNHMQDVGFRKGRMGNVYYKRKGINPGGGRYYSLSRTDLKSSMPLEFIDWLKQEYEQYKSIFSISWHDPIVSQEGMDKMGREFWAEYIKVGLFKGFVGTIKNRSQEEMDQELLAHGFL